MNISVLHNMLVIFLLFKVRHAGQDGTLNDDEYRVVTHTLFIGIFLELVILTSIWHTVLLKAFQI